LGTGTLQDVTISPDGTLLAVGEAGSTVSVYHLPDGTRAFQSFPTELTPRAAASFSPDSNLLLVYGYGTRGFELSNVKLVSSKDGATIKTLDGSSGPAVFSPDGALVAAPIPFTEPAAAALWDVRTGTRLRVTACFGRHDETLQFSGDGATLRYGRSVCSVANGAFIGNIDANIARDGITPDFKEGIRIYDGVVYAVRASDGMRLRKLGAVPVTARGSPFALVSTQVRLSYDGSVLFVTPGIEEAIHVWRFSDGSEVRRLDPQANRTGAAFSPDSRSIVSWYADKTVRIHDIATGDVTKFEPRQGHTDRITALAFSRDDALLVSTGDGTVRLWRTNDGTLLWTMPAKASAVAISEDSTVIGALVDNDTQLLGAKDGTLLRTLTDAPLLAFSPDGKVLATLIPRPPGWLLRPNGVRLWNAGDGTFIRDLTREPPVARAGGGSFSPDGQLFALDYPLVGVDYPLVGLDYPLVGVKLWRVSDGVPLPDLDGSGPPFIAFADSQSVVTGDALQSRSAVTMIRWRIRDGMPLWKTVEDGWSIDYFGGYSAAVDVSKLAFYDRTSLDVRIISLSDGRLLHRVPYEPHAFTVKDTILQHQAPAVAYARSGMFLATCVGQSIRIWCVP
jgi:WD40 repeat protein